MKKILFCIFIFVIIVFMLCSCNSIQEENNTTKTDNSQLEFINEKFVFDKNEVTFEPENNTYPLDTTEVKVTLSNNTTDKMLYFGDDYTLQKENNGKWEDVDLGLAFYSTGYNMKPGASENYSYTISNDKCKIEKGKYRIKKELTVAHIVKSKDNDDLLTHDEREGHYEDTEYYAEFSIE